MTSKPGWSARVNRFTMRTLQIAVVFGLLLMLSAESLSSAPGERMPIVSVIGVAQALTSLFAIGVYMLYRPGRKRWIAAAACASMPVTVEMLRAEDAGAGVNPLGDLAQIEDLVGRFSREGTDASCFISPELAGKIAPEITATAHRIVREALTNIRKHAQGGKQARVVVAAAGPRGLEVSVRDDGRAPRRRLADTGGGMGLLGLGERGEAVGGWLRAEPRPEGGWEVVAWLPTEAALVEWRNGP